MFGHSQLNLFCLICNLKVKQSLINPNFCLLEQRASGANEHLATPVSSMPFGGASKGNLPKAIVCPYVEAEVDPGML